MRRILLTGAATALLTTLVACSSTSPGSTPQRATPSAASAVDQAGGGRAAAAPSAGTARAAAALTTEARIRTAHLTVEVADARRVGRQADAAEGIATRVGGEVDGDERTSGTHASATVVLRVPPAALASSLSALSGLGTETSRQLSSRDVTQQVADVTSRTTSAVQAIVRLRALYASASKVSDVIAVESELSQRESDLESLQAQARTLSGQTQLATITLYLQVADAGTGAVHHDRGGFLGGLSKGWHAFTSGASHVASGAGAAVPFVVLLLVLALAVRLLRPTLRPGRLRRTRPAPGE